MGSMAEYWIDLLVLYQHFHVQKMLLSDKKLYILCHDDTVLRPFVNGSNNSLTYSIKTTFMAIGHIWDIGKASGQLLPLINIGLLKIFVHHTRLSTDQQYMKLLLRYFSECQFCHKMYIMEL